MKLAASFPLPLRVMLFFGFLILCGCGTERKDDVVEIKKNYSEFRLALIRRDYTKASTFLSSEYSARYPDLTQFLASSFIGLEAENMELRKDSRVRFYGENYAKAWLFPRSGLTVGRGFVRETNGWKVTVQVIPVVD